MFVTVGVGVRVEEHADHGLHAARRVLAERIGTQTDRLGFLPPVLGRSLVGEILTVTLTAAEALTATLSEDAFTVTLTEAAEIEAALSLDALSVTLVDGDELVVELEEA